MRVGVGAGIGVGVGVASKSSQPEPHYKYSCRRAARLVSNLEPGARKLKPKSSVPGIHQVGLPS